MPQELGETWSPPKKSQKTAAKYSAPITIDPEIFQGEISLASAISFALINNPQTSLSWAQLQGSIAELGLARKDWFPSIEISENISRNRTGFTFPPDILITQWLTTWGPQLDVNYTLWDFGARAAKSESALQALFSTAWSYNQEIQSVMRTITASYYQNLYQKATLTNDELNVQDALLILESAEKKLKTGTGDITQLVQAKTNYLQAQVILVNQRNESAASLINLAAEMGMPANLEFSTQNFPSELPGRDYIKDLDSLIDLAVQTRPEIIQKKSEIASKKAALVQARLDPLPKVEGSFNMNYKQYNNDYKSYGNVTGQLQLKFPFFDGFMYRNKIRSAKADLLQAQAFLKQAQDNTLQEVTLYFTFYQNAIERIDYASQFLDSALEEFEVMLKSYRAGTKDILNVMQAQTSLSNARSQYTESVQDLFVSLTNLAYATGSLATPESGDSWDSIYQFEEPNYE